jgi:hypothetical protein
MSDQLHALAALPPGKIAPRIQLTGGWVDPRAGVDINKMKQDNIQYLE